MSNRRVVIRQAPRKYTFQIHDHAFEIDVPYKDNLGVRPIEILIFELEEVIAQLRQMPTFETKEPFTLPPVKPDESPSV